MPENQNGLPAALAQLRVNVGRAGIVGSLVGNDLRRA